MLVRNRSYIGFDVIDIYRVEHQQHDEPTLGAHSKHEWSPLLVAASRHQHLWTFSLGTTPPSIGSLFTATGIVADFFNKNISYMAIVFDRKPTAEKPTEIGGVGRKQAYAEQRLIKATDRFIAANTTANKEKARKWIKAWRAFCTSRHR